MNFPIAKVTAGVAGVATSIGVNAIMKAVVANNMPEIKPGVTGKIQKVSLAIGSYAIAAIVTDITTNYVEARVKDVLAGAKAVKETVEQIKDEVEAETQVSEEVAKAFNVAVNNAKEAAERASEGADETVVEGKDIPDTFKNN